MRGIFRTQLWWSAKVMPVVGSALLAAILVGTEPSRGMRLLAAMLVSAAGIAGASHVVNDWADIEADALAHKRNVAAGLRAPVRAALTLTAAAVGVAPWALVHPPGAVWILIGLLVAVPVLYSVPPMRLKARGFAGVVADATDAHLAPTLLAFFLLADGQRTEPWQVGATAATLWASGLGVRSILNHQVLDLANDEAASVPTFVARHGTERAVAMGRTAFGLEVAGLVGLAGALAWSHPAVLAPFAAYAALWAVDRRWEVRVLEPVPRPGNDWMPLVEFYEVWPAVVFAGSLVIIDPVWWPVPIALLVLFAAPIAKQAADLARMVASAAHDVRVQAVRAQWWVRRRPLRWLRLSLYWPARNAVVRVTRRQGRRIRRRLGRGRPPSR